MDNFAAESLLAVPLGLSGIMQELLQRPLVPVQQLPVQQQSERSLCGHTLGSIQQRVCVCVCVCVCVRAAQ